MIVLHQFARTWGIPNLSHFCVKTETYLRMVKLPYEIVETLPFKGPKGKLPFIVDKGKKIADSKLIENYLKATYSDGLDAHLSQQEKATAKAFQRMLEEDLYWISMMSRWSYTEANWQANKRAIFSVLPPVVNHLAAFVYRRRIISQLLGQGTGRLTKQEAFELGKDDLDALSHFLADKPYFMGEKPSSLDASAYGILVDTLACPIESPLKDHALTKKNLVGFCQRMQTEFFPELPWVLA